QKPYIPFWVGGSSSGAMRRAALRGDGWHPTGVSPEEFSIGRREISEMATAAGRDPDSLTWSLRVEVEAHGGPSSERAAGRARLSGGDPDAMASSLAAYEMAGVQHVILALNTGDVATITSLMETIARAVVPRFR
ncbi:MAG: LLM class flavin-dependent oxidoreductase, partial [Chloroflexota bacterium]|nr:LLM class flavin-dependent oxidoreductase [Chloroflexota bacterium]MED5568908.1 LLM class flavin-dependent oxidoreductase [Chloroflexota bacterium]